VSVLRSSDRRPRLQALHPEHALILGISAWALSTIAAAVYVIAGVFTLGALLDLTVVKAFTA
jgi:hypothetical protein